MRAKRSNPYRRTEKAGLLRFARNDEESFEFQTAKRPHSRSMICPSCTVSLRPMRGRRECRVLAAPAVSCAMCTRKCAHEHTGTAGAARHSLHSGFTAYIVLSPETNSFCLRHRRIEGFGRNPVGFLKTSAGLTPATGARTTRLCRPRQRRSSARGLRSRA